MDEEREKTSRWQIQIPPEHYSGFSHLIELTDEDFRQFIGALQSTAPTLVRDEFVRQLDDKVSVGRDILADIIAMALSLHIVRTDMHFTAHQFTDAVMDALARVPDDMLGAAAGQRAVAHDRIQSLLEVGGALNAIAKANDLAGQNERTFLNGRVVTDLRPLFADDPTEHPTSAIVVHTLRLTYVKDYERQDFFVTLDAPGLQTLQELISRAQEKATTIAATFGASVQVLEGER